MERRVRSAAELNSALAIVSLLSLDQPTNMGGTHLPCLLSPSVAGVSFCALLKTGLTTAARTLLERRALYPKAKEIPARDLLKACEELSQLPRPMPIDEVPALVSAFASVICPAPHQQRAAEAGDLLQPFPEAWFTTSLTLILMEWVAEAQQMLERRVAAEASTTPVTATLRRPTAVAGDNKKQVECVLEGTSASALARWRAGDTVALVHMPLSRAGMPMPGHGGGTSAGGAPPRLHIIQGKWGHAPPWPHRRRRRHRQQQQQLIRPCGKWR